MDAESHDMYSYLLSQMHVCKTLLEHRSLVQRMGNKQSNKSKYAETNYKKNLLVLGPKFSGKSTFARQAGIFSPDHMRCRIIDDIWSTYDKLDVVIFMASMADYDQSLFCNIHTNAMKHAMRLFKVTYHDRFLSKFPMVLLLNHMDRFQQKIKNTPITSCPEFTDFDEFVKKYKGIVFAICQSFCKEMQNKVIAPLEIKHLIMMFCGYGLNIYHINESILNSFKWNENQVIKLKSDKYNYDLCRYYVKTKFEQLSKNGYRANTDDLHICFISALDIENIRSVMMYIIANVLRQDSAESTN